MENRILAIVVVLLALSFSFYNLVYSAADEEAFNLAQKNGRLANQGFTRCLNYVNAWLKYADPKTGLIPKNLDWPEYQEIWKKGGKDIWNAPDAAADNYPFMVLTAAITDRSLFHGRMLDMLTSETKLTSRLGTLPDTYSFSKQGFLHEQPDIHRIMFGASEYIKDGLLPITEWLGPSPWRDRLVGMLDDMWRYAPIDTPYGKIVSTNVEVNGEMLQTLPRMYWMTGEKKYLEWAIRLGDYYLLDKHHPTRDLEKLKLRDHGCEIISGLCELYATVHFAMPEKQLAYQQPIHEMLDRILEVGRNRDGLFYNKINPQDGKTLDEGLADTWGYTLNGYYTVYLIDKTPSYRQAVLQALTGLNNTKNYPWEGDTMDGYADAIEGALNLYNREPIPSVAQWIDSEIQVMWRAQMPDGMVEGWHCDGNFARTTLMYCLWKTKGVTIRPWRNDVMFGAVQQGDELMLSITAEKEWKGKVLFDQPRYKTQMKLPMDWPRINQFPEWFTVQPEKSYTVSNLTANSKQTYTGKQLIDGINLHLIPGTEQRLKVH